MTASDKSKTTLRRQVIQAVCFKPGITGHIEQFEAIEALIDAHTAAAWKDGYEKGWQARKQPTGEADNDK